MKRILAINPGSTSTKIAIFEDEKLINKTNIKHSTEEINTFSTVFDQFNFRKNALLEELDKIGIDIHTLDAVVGRGGMLKPIEGGTYNVNQTMIDYVKEAPRGEHASNLGCVIAKTIADEVGVPSFIVDPVAVDEMNDIARFTVMPELSEELFFKAITEVVKANKDDIPEYGKGQSLYIRPFAIGKGMNLGVKPSDEYIFSVFCNPVGVYFAGGLRALDFVTTDFDRASANGTGQVKVAGNYAASLYPRQQAIDAGYAGVIYLDPSTHSKIDEVGAANFFGITHDNVLVTPKSSSILPSITKRSILYIAEHMLGMKVEERECLIENISEFKEAGACGTAAIITPIGSITHKGHKHVFSTEVGPTIKKLYDTLVGIYYGDIEAPEGWIREIK